MNKDKKIIKIEDRLAQDSEALFNHLSGLFQTDQSYQLIFRRCYFSQVNRIFDRIIRTVGILRSDFDYHMHDD
jgi:hypothetical protein